MNGIISRTEWRWAAAVALAVVALSAVPYAAGYLAQTPDLRFAGAVFDLEDYHSYLGRMWQGYRGEWRFRSLFTPEAHEGVYFQPFYIVLGHLARLTGLGLPLVYQIARVIFGLAMLPVVYWFVALFASAVSVRRAAFLLAATSSGVGWLVEAVCPTPPGGISPIDFWLFDAYVFFSLFQVPHFSVAIALLLLTYGTLLRLAEKPRAALRDVALLVLCSWGLGLVHPYMLLPADLVPALYLVWCSVAERRLSVPLLLALVLMGLAQAPLLLYESYVFATEPVFQAWADQNLTLSPPLVYYILGYGLVAMFALLGIRPAGRSSRRATFLLIWIVVVFVLAYVPWGLQRRFVEGVQVGLGILAGYGLVQLVMPALARHLGRVACLLRYDPARLRWLAQNLIVVLAAVSNLYLVAGYTLAAATHHPAFFHSADQVLAVEWLQNHSRWDDTVLAAEKTGNWIVGAIGHRVVLGHWAETVDYEGKRIAVARFFSDASDAERLALAKGWQVAWLFYGPEERALGGFDPDSAPWLVPAFRQDEVAIYRVALGGEP